MNICVQISACHLIVCLCAGYYIYTEASNQPANSTARIISQSMTISDVGTCIHFWFHMYGTKIGTLNVYAQQGTEFPAVLHIYIFPIAEVQEFRKMNGTGYIT